MDELTRERFWPKPRPAPVAPDAPLLDPVILDRRRVLLDDPDYGREGDQQTRLRAQANARHRKLVRAIRQFRGAA